MGHQPIDPPPKFRREMERAISSGTKSVYLGITLRPPNEKYNRWRVQVAYEGRKFDKTYGPGIGNAYKGYLQADEWLTREKAGFQGHPEYESAWLADFIDDYVERRGKDGRWADKTQHQRKGDFRALVKIAEDRHLRCKDLKAVHLRDYLAAVTTASRVRTIKGAHEDDDHLRPARRVLHPRPGRAHRRHHLDPAAGLPAGTDPARAVTPARRHLHRR